MPMVDFGDLPLQRAKELHVVCLARRASGGWGMGEAGGDRFGWGQGPTILPTRAFRNLLVQGLEFRRLKDNQRVSSPFVGRQSIDSCKVLSHF